MTPQQGEKHPEEPPNGVCLDEFQLGQVAVALKELEACKRTVTERERLIAEQRELVAPAPMFWQDPVVIVGGLAVTAAVSSIVTLVLTRR